jgi:hypothetical protein
MTPAATGGSLRTTAADLRLQDYAAEEGIHELSPK